MQRCQHTLDQYNKAGSRAHRLHETMGNYDHHYIIIITHDETLRLSYVLTKFE